MGLVKRRPRGQAASRFQRRTFVAACPRQQRSPARSTATEPPVVAYDSSYPLSERTIFAVRKWCDLVKSNPGGTTLPVRNQRKTLYARIERDIEDPDQRIELSSEIVSLIAPGELKYYDYQVLIYLEACRPTTDSAAKIQQLALTAAETLNTPLGVKILEVATNTLIALSKSTNYSCIYTAFDTFQQAMLKLYGSHDLTTGRYTAARNVLAAILREIKEPARLIPYVDAVYLENPGHGVTLLASCIWVARHPVYKVPDTTRDYLETLSQTAEDVGKRKQEREQSLLLAEMKRLVKAKKFRKVVELYRDDPTAHSRKQIGVLLQCYAELRDWNGLQTLFESLFQDKSKLPDLAHYRIVMAALARIARVDIVDSLFDGLQSRHLQPTTSIVNALMYARLALGDVPAVEDLFARFASFDVEPDSQTYRILITAYAHARDLRRASEAFTKMAGFNVRITPDLIRAILLVCAKRRDTVSAAYFFDWAKDYGVFMGRMVYNSYLNCLVQSDDIDTALLVYKEMRGKKIVASAKTYAILLSYFARKKIMAPEKALIMSLLTDMKESNIRPSSIFYKYVMIFYFKSQRYKEAFALFDEVRQYARKRNWEMDSGFYEVVLEFFERRGRINQVEKLYQEMRADNVIPTFKVHATYLRAIAQKRSNIHDPRESTTAEQYLLDFLADESFLDLTSPYLPRDRVPPAMIKPVLDYLLKRGQALRAKALLTEYTTSPRGHRIEHHIALLELAIRIYANLKEWDNVMITWRQTMRLLTRFHVKDPKYASVREGSEFKIPTRHMGIVTRIVNARFEQLIALGQAHEAIPTVTELMEHGYRLSNPNLNLMVEALVADPAYVLQGFAYAEKELMPGRLRWLAFSMKRLHRNPQAPRPTYVKFEKFASIRLLKVLMRARTRALGAIKRSLPPDAPIGTVQTFESRFPLLARAFALAKRRFEAKTKLRLHREQFPELYEPAFTGDNRKRVVERKPKPRPTPTGKKSKQKRNGPKTKTLRRQRLRVEKARSQLLEQGAPSIEAGDRRDVDHENDYPQYHDDFEDEENPNFDPDAFEHQTNNNRHIND